MGSTDASGTGRLTVLHSLRIPRPGTTGYVDQMVDGAAPAVDPCFFSWRQAILGRYDVLHAHWPELMIRDPQRWRAFVKRRAMDVLALRLARTRTPLVWTAHNLDPHESGTAAERRSLRKFKQMVDLAIRLNPTTELPEQMAGTTILHGHYRDRFAAYPVREAEPGRLLYFGIIRPYKGVDTLLAAFASLPGEDVSLRVVGHPHAGQAEPIEAAVAGDPRITADLRFVDDDELVDEVYRSQLVVLPYKEKMHNSGVVLVALSLNRPVLVPASASNAALAAEVGPGWVLQYEGELTAEVLRDALVTVAGRAADAVPDLAGRDWDEVGRQHETAYRQAIATKRTPHRPGPS